MSDTQAGLLPAAGLAASPAGRGPAVLRSLAAAFGHLRDFDRFVGGLQAALEETEWFGRLTLDVKGTPGEREAQFVIGEMTLPIQGETATHGTLRAAGTDGPRFYGPEDLHLLAGLADFLAAVLDRARDWREVERQRQMLGFLLNQAPVGIMACDEQRRLVAANDLARRWLGGGPDLWGALQARLPADAPPAGSDAPSCFHLRAEGRLVFGELRVASGGGVAVAVMTDLSADQARLFDGLRRETYRCQWRHLRLTFALLDSPVIAGGLLQGLPALRAGLPGSTVAGPYDANRVGLVFPECGRSIAAARLRRVGRLAADATVRAGLAELGRDGSEPEALLQAAVAGLKPLREALRPSVLLHDDNSSVNDSLALVLGRDFEVVTSTSVERTRQLLRGRSFDALITEVELRALSGVELARFAIEAQPEIRRFFTTVSELSEGAAADPGAAGAVVFRKPFDMHALATTLKEQLLPPENPPA